MLTLGEVCQVVLNNKIVGMIRRLKLNHKMIRKTHSPVTKLLKKQQILGVIFRLKLLCLVAGEKLHQKLRRNHNKINGIIFQRQILNKMNGILSLEKMNSLLNLETNLLKMDGTRLNPYLLVTNGM